MQAHFSAIDAYPERSWACLMSGSEEQKHFARISFVDSIVLQRGKRLITSFSPSSKTSFLQIFFALKTLLAATSEGQ